MTALKGYYIHFNNTLRLEYGPELKYRTMAHINDIGTITWYVWWRDNRKPPHVNVSHLLFMKEDALFQESLIHDFNVYLVKASMKKLLAKIESNNYDYEDVYLEF